MQDYESTLHGQAYAIAQELENRKRRRKILQMYPESGPLSRKAYAKYMEFFEAGHHYRERLALAANRVGKTEGIGGYEVAMHLTGWYPKWWKGKRFDLPIKVWAAGDTGKTVRDIIQTKLLGPPDDWGSGLIPHECINFESMTRISGVADAVDSVRIKHAGGWENTIAFKSYDQKRKAFQGTEQDIIWLDEEPPEDVYAECLIRTMTTNGMMILTFTPLSGMTQVVLSYLEDQPSNENPDHEPTKYMLTLTWDDAPHLTEEQKQQLWKSIPVYQRDARAKGVPQLGSGAIYAIAEDQITVDDFKIPPHWPRAYGFDVGWNNTAVAWGAKDLESGVLYIYAVYKRGQAEPVIHAESIKSRGRMKGYIDPASRGRSQVDGVAVVEQYSALGLDLDFAQNAVEAGIYEVWQGLSTGNIKIFKSCGELFKEYRLYRRDEKGKIVKSNDHIMDAFRYLVMSAEDELRKTRAVADDLVAEKQGEQAAVVLLGSTGGLGWMGA